MIKYTLYTRSTLFILLLTLNLLMTTIVAPPSNASKWQMGFNSTFKGLKQTWDMHKERHEFNIQNKIQCNFIPQKFFSARDKVKKTYIFPCTSILYL
jgi:hypothetical protein